MSRSQKYESLTPATPSSQTPFLAIEVTLPDIPIRQEGNGFTEGGPLSSMGINRCVTLTEKISDAPRASARGILVKVSEVAVRK